jgi:hypothetical protein
VSTIKRVQLWSVCMWLRSHAALFCNVMLPQQLYLAHCTSIVPKIAKNVRHTHHMPHALVSAGLLFSPAPGTATLPGGSGGGTPSRVLWPAALFADGPPANLAATAPPPTAAVSTAAVPHQPSRQPLATPVTVPAFFSPPRAPPPAAAHNARLHVRAPPAAGNAPAGAASNAAAALLSPQHTTPRVSNWSSVPAASWGSFQAARQELAELQRQVAAGRAAVAAGILGGGGGAGFGAVAGTGGAAIRTGLSAEPTPVSNHTRAVMAHALTAPSAGPQAAATGAAAVGAGAGRTQVVVPRLQLGSLVAAATPSSRMQPPDRGSSGRQEGAAAGDSGSARSGAMEALQLLPSTDRSGSGQDDRGWRAASAEPGTARAETGAGSGGQKSWRVAELAAAAVDLRDSGSASKHAPAGGAPAGGVENLAPNIIIGRVAGDAGSTGAGAAVAPICMQPPPPRALFGDDMLSPARGPPPATLHHHHLPRSFLGVSGFIARVEQDMVAAQGPPPPQHVRAKLQPIAPDAPAPPQPLRTASMSMCVPHGSAMGRGSVGQHDDVRDRGEASRRVPALLSSSLPASLSALWQAGEAAAAAVAAGRASDSQLLVDSCAPVVGNNRHHGFPSPGGAATPKPRASPFAAGNQADRGGCATPVGTGGGCHSPAAMHSPSTNYAAGPGAKLSKLKSSPSKKLRIARDVPAAVLGSAAAAVVAPAGGPGGGSHNASPLSKHAAGGVGGAGFGQVLGCGLTAAGTHVRSHSLTDSGAGSARGTAMCTAASSPAAATHRSLGAASSDDERCGEPAATAAHVTAGASRRAAAGYRGYGAGRGQSQSG